MKMTHRARMIGFVCEMRDVARERMADIAVGGEVSVLGQEKSQKGPCQEHMKRMIWNPKYLPTSTQNRQIHSKIRKVFC